jgi:hypothetical protein
MSTALAAWADLVETVNGRVAFGQAGVRDPEHPCEMFAPVANPDWLGLEVRAPGNGTCDSDGHYLCGSCLHLSRGAKLDRLDQPFCPNCRGDALGGLYSHEVQREDDYHDSWTVTHCGCFHAPERGKARYHASDGIRETPATERRGEADRG